MHLKTGRSGPHYEIDPPSEQPGMLALIDRYVRDPSIDVEKMERLWAIYREEQARAALSDFNDAMNRAQEEIQPVVRTAENKQTNSFYAKLENVDAAIRPIYIKHGFSLSFNTVPPLVEGNVRIEGRCARGGHVERFYREAPPDVLGPKGSPTKTSLHGIGSTENFLKRYMTCGMFNIVFRNQDDDGNGAQGYIDDAQINHLRELIGKVKALDPKRDESTFCKYMRVMTLPELTQQQYRKATSALEEAISKLSQKASADA